MSYPSFPQYAGHGVDRADPVALVLEARIPSYLQEKANRGSGNRALSRSIRGSAGRGCGSRGNHHAAASRDDRCPSVGIDAAATRFAGYSAVQQAGEDGDSIVGLAGMLGLLWRVSLRPLPSLPRRRLFVWLRLRRVLLPLPRLWLLLLLILLRRMTLSLRLGLGLLAALLLGVVFRLVPPLLL